MSKRNFSAEDSVRSAKKPKADSEDLIEGLRSKNLLVPAKKNAKQDEEKEEGTKGPRRRTPEELKKLFASRRKREEETRKMHEETFQKLPEEKKAIVSAVREVVGKETVFFSESFMIYDWYLCTIQESETTHLSEYGEGSSELRNVLDKNNATIRWEDDGFFVIANVYLLDDKPKKKPNDRVDELGTAKLVWSERQPQVGEGWLLFDNTYCIVLEAHETGVSLLCRKSDGLHRWYTPTDQRLRGPLSYKDEGLKRKSKWKANKDHGHLKKENIYRPHCIKKDDVIDISCLPFRYENDGRWHVEYRLNNRRAERGLPVNWILKNMTHVCLPDEES